MDSLRYGNKSHVALVFDILFIIFGQWRSLAFCCHLFWLYSTLGFGHTFQFRWPYFGLLELWNASLPRCYLCRQLEGIFDLLLKRIQLTMSINTFSTVVDYSIPPLDSPFCDLDPALRIRIYGSHFSLLRFLVVSIRQRTVFHFDC